MMQDLLRVIGLDLKDLADDMRKMVEDVIVQAHIEALNVEDAAEAVEAANLEFEHALLLSRDPRTAKHIHMGCPGCTLRLLKATARAGVFQQRCEVLKC